MIEMRWSNNVFCSELNMGYSLTVHRCGSERDNNSTTKPSARHLPPRLRQAQRDDSDHAERCQTSPARDTSAPASTQATRERDMPRPCGSRTASLIGFLATTT